MGKVFIDDWNEQYGSLGVNMRQFMDSRPEFHVIPIGEGRAYSVALASPSDPGDVKGGKRSSPYGKAGGKGSGGKGKRMPNAMDGMGMMAVQDTIEVLKKGLAH